MLKFPADLNQQFDTFLMTRTTSNNECASYKKWLRFYWDFCYKYHHEVFNAQSLSFYIQKLQEKRQSEQQQNQAKHAVSLFYEMHNSINQLQVPISHSERQKINPSLRQNLLSDTSRDLRPSPVIGDNPPEKKGTSWVYIFDQLVTEIKLRHYSPKTLKAYRGWIRQLQTFTKSKDYQQLSQQDVVDFLSYLAVKKQVSASSQNQAFNALLFLFKQVLKQEFGEIKGVARAKRERYTNPNIYLC